jgi:choline dehydrogenase-like flavoprotein
VIVGSGCGGGVAARTFAEAGLRVIVVDKGFYWAPEYLPLSEEGGPLRLFMDGGIISKSSLLRCSLERPTIANVLQSR